MECALLTLRNKYAEDLEEILQCPVCFERLSGPVPMCLQGHHVCHRCQVQIHDCPLCKDSFNGTRNYLAEALLSKFDEIKSSLIEPKHNTNWVADRSKLSVSTQTDFSSVPNEDEETTIDPKLLIKNNKNDIEKEALRNPPAVGKGKYPCKIGNCDMELPHGRMIPHIRYYHEDNFIEEKIMPTGCYTMSWKLEYAVPNQFDRAINIHNMGLFFLSMSINDQGHLHGKLLIVNGSLIAQDFKYTLEISTLHNSTSYKGKVAGCRTKQKAPENGLYVEKLFMEHIMKNNKKFTCNLSLKRSVTTDISKKSKKSKETA